YRSPAIPAMAVLVGCGVAAAAKGLREGRARPAVAFVVAAAAVAVIGAVPPRPAPRPEEPMVAEGIWLLEQGNLDGAEQDARAALAADVGPLPIGAWILLMDVGRGRGDPAQALPWARKLVQAQPWNPTYRTDLAKFDLADGRKAEALASMND